MLDQDKYLQEAIRIGNSILEKAIITEDKCYWQTMNVSSSNRKIIWEESENLYSGVAGIAYFFMELHRVTDDERYYNLLIKTANWLEWYCHNYQTDYYAFYTGRLGVSFLFLAIADYTQNDAYVDKALKIAENCDQFLQSNDLVCDLINGVSGALLALVHIHEKTKNDQILHSIRKFTNYLIKHIHSTDYGIYWDRSPKNIRGLCGFSHGTSGIGYVFLELSRYFQNPTFQWIADQAFSYENYHFDKKVNNWPDFRRGFYTEETYKQHYEAYHKGDKSFFLENRYMSAWCHGAPGIGLSRVRASETTNKKYVKDLRQALDHTKKSDVDENQEYVSYTLCHGLGGNAFLFLEANRLMPDKKLLHWSKKVGDYAIEFHSKHANYISGYGSAGLNEDISLFMGNAGIGLFMIYLAENGLDKPSILKPDIPSENFFYDAELSKITKQKITETYAALHFPKTIKSLNISNLHISYKNTILSKMCIEYLENHIRKSEELFQFEISKYLLDRDIEGYSYLHISQKLEIEKNHEFLSENSSIESLHLKLPEHYKIIHTPENYSGNSNYLLLRPSYAGVEEIPLTEFLHIVLNKFQREAHVDNVLISILDDFEETSKEQEIRAFVTEQIKQAMIAGLLIQSQ